MRGIKPVVQVNDFNTNAQIFRQRRYLYMIALHSHRLHFAFAEVFDVASPFEKGLKAVPIAL